MRYVIRLSYNGSAFSGWQIQNNAPSVQGALQDALSMLCGEPVTVTGAGRTDAGVNASNYVAHFDVTLAVADCDKLAYRLNAVLPRQVVVHNVAPVSDDFHARFSATSRQYKYFIHFTKDPFNDQFSWHCKYRLDVDKMNKACEYLLGVHDCTCFEKKGSDNATSICDIKFAHWQETSGATPLPEVCPPADRSSGRGPLDTSSEGTQETMGGSEDSVESEASGRGVAPLVFTVEANRFLRNMVRAIVGTMVDIGRGVHEPEYILEILDHGTRGDAGQSVPGNALFLTKIEY